MNLTTRYYIFDMVATLEKNSVFKNISSFKLFKLKNNDVDIKRSFHYLKLVLKCSFYRYIMLKRSICQTHQFKGNFPEPLGEGILFTLKAVFLEKYDSLRKSRYFQTWYSPVEKINLNLFKNTISLIQSKYNSIT